MLPRVQCQFPFSVAPLAGSVDRNVSLRLAELLEQVAPLAGSVDRNISEDWVASETVEVAPLAGSVDRNGPVGVALDLVYVAPLAGSVDRNDGAIAQGHGINVAPLAGSVDRNSCFSAYSWIHFSSLPSRKKMATLDRGPLGVSPLMAT